MVPMNPSKGLSPGDRMKLLAHQVSTTALDLLFPPVCVNCGRVGSFLCARCLESIPVALSRSVPGLDGVVTGTEFDGAVRAGVHELKYGGQKRLAEPLGTLIAQSLHDMAWPIDIVCAVPMHDDRLRERGYNQAFLLAQEVAHQLGWHLETAAVRRVRYTQSQVELNARERRENVAGAFVANPARVAGMSILLVDDVLTTGATVAACADAAGAICVYGAAVASAKRGQDGTQ
jgi:competence protein ComFC